MADMQSQGSEDESESNFKELSGQERGIPKFKKCPKFSLKKHPKFKKALGHVTLIAMLIFYTAFGAKVFQWLEQPNELNMANEMQKKLLLSKRNLIEFWEILQENITQKENLTEEVLLNLEKYEELVAEAVSSGIPRLEGEKPTQWTYTQSVFFASTVLTTIGYGNIAPSTTMGRFFCMFFAFIGIPFTLTVIADLGSVMASSVSVVYKKMKVHGDVLFFNSIKQRSLSASSPGIQNSPFHRFRRKYGKTFSAALAISLLMVYLSVGAGLFMIWEEWSFLEAFYFCFITMTTIGFGDLVPAQTTYMLVCTFYILIGLALTSTIIELIRRQYAESWQRMRELTNKLHGLAGPLADTLRKLGEHKHGEPIDPNLLRELVDLKKALNAVRNEIGVVRSSVDFEDELIITKKNGGYMLSRGFEADDEDSIGFDAESEGLPMEWEENWEDLWFKLESGERTPYTIMKILSETSIKC